MTEQHIIGTGADSIAPAITQTDLDRARTEGASAGRTSGATAERERIRAILTHSEAAGREAQANTLALETELTAEQAAKVLAASPKQLAAAGTAFDAAMRAAGNPKIDPAGDGENNVDPQAEASRCVELFQGGRRK